MAFFSQRLLLEVPRVSASISPTDKRTETRQPPLERVRFFLSCHVNNSISRFAAIRLVFQYWVTFDDNNDHNNNLCGENKMLVTWKMHLL